MESGHFVGACGLAYVIQMDGILMLELIVPGSFFVLFQAFWNTPYKKGEE